MKYMPAAEYTFSFSDAKRKRASVHSKREGQRGSVQPKREAQTRQRAA
jgi:hypothetical protein